MLARYKNGGLREAEKPVATKGRTDLVKQRRAKRAITG